MSASLDIDTRVNKVDIMKPLPTRGFCIMKTLLDLVELEPLPHKLMLQIRFISVVRSGINIM